MRGDGSFAAQLLENGQGALRQQPSVAVEALDLRDAPFVVLERLDATALRECVQHPLFWS